MLALPHYNGDYAANARSEGPKCVAGTCFRNLYDEEDLVEYDLAALDPPLPESFQEALNDAPTLAFNRLLGRQFFRSKMEGIWARAIAVNSHPSRALLEYLVDGGLREHGFTGGSRIPYLGADYRVHALALAPVGQLLNQTLRVMEDNAYLFNLAIAAEASCRNAIIRLDTLHLMNDEITNLRPRISSNLLSVRRFNNLNPH